MQINIETYGDDNIDLVTVTAHGESGRNLLDKLIPPPPPPLRVEAKPSACSLREAEELFRAMGQENVSYAITEMCRQVADLLQQLADGNKKICAIKAVRTLSNMGLKEAKDLIERAGPFRLQTIGSR